MFFGGDILNGRIGLGLFDQGHLTQGPNPLGVIFCLFLNDTRLKFSSCGPLIGLLAFVVRKLWP